MRMRIIDAFAERPFSGNPAAVCLLDAPGWPEESWMRAVAIEMNLPMTAFAFATPEDPAADWALRWFNAVVEERLCGHATLATAHALRSDGAIGDSVRFSTVSGVLTAHAGDDGIIALDFPRAQLTEIDAPAALADALDAEPQAAFATGALGDVMAVLADEATVRGLLPDMDALGNLTEAEGLRGITVTAAATDAAASGYDFVSRFFSPAHGLPEDPVTGSAHTALAPYWSARLGREELTGLQVSARTGRVQTELRDDRVLLSGRAVTVLDGALCAHPELAVA